jgi:hypothetical protein
MYRLARSLEGIPQPVRTFRKEIIKYICTSLELKYSASVAQAVTY